MVAYSTVSQGRELSRESSDTSRPWPDPASSEKFGYCVAAQSCAQEGAYGSIPASEPPQVTFQQQSSNDSVNKPCATVYCQVLGCQERLTKSYCIKKRACAAHLQAEAVQLSSDDTNLWRFCQQCGKFELLSKFDDTKRSCRARLAKRRSGTRAQLLKKPNLMRATSEHKAAPEQAAAAEITHAQPPEVCHPWGTADPVMQLPPDTMLPTAGSHPGTAAADGDLCPALHFSQQMQQQQMLSIPDECDLEALLLEGESTATSATAAAATFMPAGGHPLSTVPLMDPSMQSPHGSTPAAAAASGALMRLGGQEQAALAHLMDLEDSDIGEEGNLDAIILQDDVVAALQQELEHNWQPPAAVSFQQKMPPLVPAGGDSISGGSGFMPSGPSGSGDSSGNVHVAGVVAPAVAGEPVQCYHCAAPMWTHKQQARSPVSAMSAFTAASRLASAATHVEGLSSVSAELLRLQSDASVTNMCGSGAAAAARTMAQQSPQAAAAVVPSLEHMQQQMGSFNPNDRANSNSSRLQWLMQQLQQELQQCQEDDLYDLEDEELNMLLLTALTPSERVDARQAGPATAAAHEASANSHQGRNLQRCAGHFHHQQQQQVWVGPGTRSSAAWPPQTTTGPMLHPMHQTATHDRLATSTATAVLPPAVPFNRIPSAIAATATAADTWLMQQQQQQLLPPNLGLPGSVQGSAPGLSGLFYDCSGSISLGWPVGVPAVAGQDVSGHPNGGQLGAPHQHHHQAQSISHNRQQLRKQQGYVQMPGWWQQQHQYL